MRATLSCVPVPWKVAVIPLFDEVDDDVRAMAVEVAWAGAAHLTLVTRREEQGREVAERVQRASGVPCEWQQWSAPVQLPKGTTMLMNATHLGCAPALEQVPVDWETVDAGCVAVDVITNPRTTPFLETARARLSGRRWSGDAGAAGDADLRGVDGRAARGARVPARSGERARLSQVDGDALNRPAGSQGTHG